MILIMACMPGYMGTNHASIPVNFLGNSTKE